MKKISFNMLGNKQLVAKDILETNSSKEIVVFIPKGQKIANFQNYSEVLIHVVSGKIKRTSKDAQDAVFEQNECIFINSQTKISIISLEDAIIRISIFKIN